MTKQNRSVKSIVLLLSIAAAVNAQMSPTVSQSAKHSPCANIVALSGAKVDCGNLTEAQKKALSSIPSVLKMALENQNYLISIMETLDKMSKAEADQNNATVGSISQGPGSAVSFGQQGGVTAGTVISTTPLLQIQWHKLADIDSTPYKAKYAETIEVESNIIWTPVSLAVICDQEISGIQLYGSGAWTNMLLSLAAEDKRVGLVRFTSPALAPDLPLQLVVISDNPINVLRVGKAVITQQ